MEAAIREQLIDTPLDIELVRGAGGVFDVSADGEQLFSKHESGRFPDHDEIIDQLQARVA